MWNVGVSQMQHINPKTVQLMNNLFSLLDIILTFPVHSHQLILTAKREVADTGYGVFVVMISCKRLVVFYLGAEQFLYKT